jgi:hypothetical protein
MAIPSMTVKGDNCNVFEDFQASIFGLMVTN